jgi:hypothetical protein
MTGGKGESESVASKSSTIPFVGGHDTTADKHLAGLSRLRTVINGRLDADGRIISRPNYTALATTTYGNGSHVCYDLFELDGRLCSLGDRLGLGHPTDVFEFVESGGAAAWKPTSLSQVTEPPRLPRGTHLREVGRPPDQRGGASGFDIAVCAGFVLLTYNDTSGPPTGYAHLMRASSGQTILFREFDGAGTAPKGQLQAVGLASRLWAIGTSSSTLLVTARRLDPATDEDWTGTTTLLSNAGGFGVIAVDKVGGADQFVVATCSVGLDIVVRRFDSSGTLIVPSGGQYSTIAGINAQYIAVEADTAANQLNVATSDGAGLVRVYTWNLSTGAAIGVANTPAEVATEVCQQLTMARASTIKVQLLATCSSVGTPDVMRVFNWDYSPGTGLFATGIPVMGVQLTSGAVFLSGIGTTVFGCATDDAETTPNMLLEHGNAASDRVGVVAAKDLGFASPPNSGGLPKIAVDTTRTPTRYYWAHGVENTDGSSIPVVCELRLTDPGRRQIARIGRGAVISGACPAWYDGGQVVELGFSQRPRIVSLASSNTAPGGLAGGATYSYRAHLSWFDILGRFHRSAVSLPVPITLGAADDTVTAVIADAHTGRHNKGSAPLGSVVRVELYRTRAIVTKTPPVLAGSQNADPPTGVLNGLTVFVYTETSAGVGAQAIVTFTAADTTLATVIARFAAVAAGNYAVTGSAGGVVLTATDTGGGSFIQINGNATALGILGFTDGQSDNGTTEIELGDVFHQTKTAYTVVGGASGDRVTIVDIRDDDDDSQGIASQAVLYTQLESPLSDHSPLPSDRCWAGPERVEMAGHPRRESWSSSQLVDTIRAPSWAAEGTPGFSGSLIESIEAVITQGTSKLYLTNKSVWQVDGNGPGTNGQGGFRAARQVFADGGLVADGWRSILDCSAGTWMQLGSDKLYLMAPGSSPTWAGFPIRELLRTFPVIAAACRTGNDQVAAFALQNTAATSGRIALYDLRRGVWFVDDTGDVPVALADFQGRLCYANTSGTVKMADTAAGVGAFVPLTLETGHATVFGVAGEGDVPAVMFVGSLLGDCTLELQVDYDDGGGFVTCGTFALTGTVGRTVREQFDIATTEVAGQFALKLLVTGSSGSAGLALSALEVYSDRDPGPALLGNSFRR